MISFSKIIEYCNDYSFEIICGLCITFLLLFALYNKIVGHKGSWSNCYYRFDKDLERIKNEEKEYHPKRTFGGDSKGEIECRRILEQIFNRPFNKIRPNFLRNEVSGGNNLELDCFNEELKLAVEYDGIQHAKYTPFFHKNHQDFLIQKYKDDMKNRMCKDEGIYLIRVPHTIKLENIENYLKNELKEYIRQNSYRFKHKN